MRRQRQYLSGEEILHDIDLCKKRIKRLRKRGETFHKAADDLVKGNDPTKITEINKLRDEANALIAKAFRMENTRLVRLGQTLSAFRTTPMLGIVGNEGVVLQNK